MKGTFKDYKGLELYINGGKKTYFTIDKNNYAQIYTLKYGEINKYLSYWTWDGSKIPYYADAPYVSCNGIKGYLGGYTIAAKEALFKRTFYLASYPLPLAKYRIKFTAFFGGNW